MDHNEALSLMATERYLLNELSPELRERYEEHLFGCQECALDARALALFVEHSKTVLSTPALAGQLASSPAAKPHRWLAFLRPAFTVPLIVLVLGLLAYLTTYRELKRADAPQLLPAVSMINTNSRGASIPVVNTRPGESFILFVDIPSEPRFASYVAELNGPSQVREWSLLIPGEATKDTLTIRVPRGLKSPGTYTLIITGSGAVGVRASEVGHYSFQLQHLP
jgi:Putative zinc-finger